MVAEESPQSKKQSGKVVRFKRVCVQGKHPRRSGQREEGAGLQFAIPGRGSGGKRRGLP